MVVAVLVIVVVVVVLLLVAKLVVVLVKVLVVRALERECEYVVASLPKSPRFRNLRPAKDSARHAGHDGANSFLKRRLLSRSATDSRSSRPDLKKGETIKTNVRIALELHGSENY